MIEPLRLSDTAPPFSPETPVTFDYPRHNYYGVPQSRWERRRIRVTVIRDLMELPLDPITGGLNPLLRRGRWLVSGYDLDRCEERSFYFEAMQNIS